MSENKLADLSMDFAVSALKLTDTLKGRYSLRNQLERSATSIGANIREAKYAHSKADFIAKLHIALKECSERGYWLELLIESGDWDDRIILDQCIEAKKLLISSINTAKNNLKIGYPSG